MTSRCSKKTWLVLSFGNLSGLQYPVTTSKRLLSYSSSGRIARMHRVDRMNRSVVGEKVDDWTPGQAVILDHRLPHEPHRGPAVVVDVLVGSDTKRTTWSESSRDKPPFLVAVFGFQERLQCRFSWKGIGNAVEPVSESKVLP